ncbi:hypothetical protein ACPB8Q_03935 [Methanocaldococcus indicus]|uniref:hypothetical protein n=1 Tax=Methanocaldococcus indicus TaxID=213231 RepID=UPI003C6CF473
MISLFYPSILAFLLGVIVGYRYRYKLKHFLSYLIISIIIAKFLGAFPYYNLPLSFEFVFAILGIFFGNRVLRREHYDYNNIG